MNWYWYVFITLQVVADIFFFLCIGLLVLAHNTVNKNTKAVAKATMGLYHLFGLDAVMEQQVPPPVATTKQSDTKLN